MDQQMEVLDNESLGGIQAALQQCERKSLDVSLELELRTSLDEHHVRALTHAIQQNKQISTVKFHLRGGWEEISPANRASVSELVVSVAPLPNLKEFIVVGDFAPILSITSLLTNASQLKILRLEGFRNLKSCDTQVLVDFCRALQRHMVVRSLSFKPHIENRCEPQESSVIDMLLEALAEIPIQQVEIVTNVRCLAGPPLVKGCNSSSLVKLDLQPRDGVGADGLQALARNSSIRELLLNCQLAEVTIAALSQLLRVNSVVKTLTILFPVSETCNDGLSDLIRPFTDALTTNKTLSYLRVPFGLTHPTLPVLQIFANIFRNNFTLQTLELFRNMSTVRRANYEDIDNMSDKVTKEALLLGKRIMYYCLLNRSGRGELLSTGTNRLHWVEKLVEFSYSLDHIYFFLRTNPTLCSEVAESNRALSSPANARKRSRG